MYKPLSEPDQISDRIACIDYEKKTYYSYHLPSSICEHKSILTNEDDDIYLYVFGGKKSREMMYLTSMKSNQMYKIRWKLRLTKQLEWDIERLIWIAYYKNAKNENIGASHSYRKYTFINQSNMIKQCIFAKISKDVLLHVLSFIR